MRRALPLLVLFAPAVVLAGGLWPTPPAALPPLDVPAGIASLSAQTCNGCHAEVHDGWAASAHAHAATDPIWRAGARLLGDPPLCRECHQPMAEQRSDLPDGPGALATGRGPMNPAWSPTLAQEGVTCAACHVREGRILGPRDLPAEQVPHPVQRSEALVKADFCAGCHQAALPGAEDRPWLDTFGEWERSAFGQAGIRCQDCHMVRTSGAVAGSRFAAFASHEGAFPRDPKALARAVTLEIGLRAPSLSRNEQLRATATLSNTGAGHAVPTGDPSHRVELRWTVLDPAGKAAGDSRSDWLFREVSNDAPFREVKDARLAAGATRTFDFQWEPGKKAAPGEYTLRVELVWWAISPDQMKAAGLNVERVTVPFHRQDLPLRVD